MRLTSRSLAEGQRVPERCAFGVPDPEQRTAPGRNLSPHLGWAGLPRGTCSLALVCHDPDAPSQACAINREDREVPADLPRVNAFLWLLADLDPAAGELAEGACAEGVIPGGKRAPQGPHGSRQGVNDYTDRFAGDASLGGTYYGYDGPCPPWNDAVPHRYVFSLYALDTPRLPLAAGFRGRDLLAAVRPHVLAQARLTATYSLNPRVPAS